MKYMQFVSIQIPKYHNTGNGKQCVTYSVYKWQGFLIMCIHQLFCVSFVEQILEVLIIILIVHNNFGQFSISLDVSWNTKGLMFRQTLQNNTSTFQFILYHWIIITSSTDICIKGNKQNLQGPEIFWDWQIFNFL